MYILVYAHALRQWLGWSYVCLCLCVFVFHMDTDSEQICGTSYKHAPPVGGGYVTKVVVDVAVVGGSLFSCGSHNIRICMHRTQPTRNRDETNVDKTKKKKLRFFFRTVCKLCGCLFFACVNILPNNVMAVRSRLLIIVHKSILWITNIYIHIAQTAPAQDAFEQIGQ